MEGWLICKWMTKAAMSRETGKAQNVSFLLRLKANPMIADVSKNEN